MAYLLPGVLFPFLTEFVVVKCSAYRPVVQQCPLQVYSDATVVIVEAGSLSKLTNNAVNDIYLGRF